MLRWAAIVFACVGLGFGGCSDWVKVGDPCAPCDEQPQGCFGAVDHEYLVGRYEITNEQWVYLLEAVAVVSDPYGLYDRGMTKDALGGIVRTGEEGAWSYAVKPGAEHWPVNFVSWYDALRFANWHHNGRPTGVQDASTTEAGAYTFDGLHSVGPRNPGALFFLVNEDEWYKAAYYQPGADAFYDYPAGSDAPTEGAAPGTEPNTANVNFAVNALTPVGSYPASPSPSGTFDQGGNVYEWTETVDPASPLWRAARGGSWGKYVELLAASYRTTTHGNFEGKSYGFRLGRPVPGGAVCP